MEETLFVPTPLFVFGSLRDSDVLEIVIGRPPTHIRSVAASLAGYRLVRLPDESYPVLVATGGATVEGGLLYGLTDEDLDRIAFFENQEYRFERCTVSLAGGSQQEALFCRENEVASGATESWTLNDWQQLDKPVFLAHTIQYMKLYGAASAEEADEVWRNMKKNAG